MIDILVLEEVSPAGLDVLRAEPDFKVTELYDDDASAVRESLSTAEGLLVRSKTKVTAEFLEQAPVLKVIGRPGTGVDNIDVAASTRRGIVVMNTPAGNSISAAEHAFGLMLALLRRIPQADASVKEGRWDRKRFMGAEASDKVLGIIGLGKIGMEVAARAQSFKMKTLAFDPHVSESVARDRNVTLVTLEELLAQADVVTLHAPLNAATRRGINAERLALMKEGAYLVNTARGELVDEQALLGALRAGKLAGAALDVFSSEPRPDPELVRMPNVIATPHIGASTREAQEKVGFDIAVQVRDYFKDGIVRNAVNFPSVSMAEYRRLAPSLRLGERLGSFASQISQGRMQEITVRYYGELAQESTHLVSSSILAGALQPVLTEARVTLVNAVQTAKERGIHFLESRSTRQRSYQSLISVKLITDAGEFWVEGTAMERDHLHIVSVFGIEVDAPLAGDMLVIRNTDTPGVIGSVGTTLGGNQINIANFALGRNPDVHEAVGLVNVDSEVPDAVLRQLCGLPHVLDARLVRL